MQHKYFAGTIEILRFVAVKRKIQYNNFFCPIKMNNNILLQALITNRKNVQCFVIILLNVVLLLHELPSTYQQFVKIEHCLKSVTVQR